MKIDIRPEEEPDYKAIYQLIDKAFGRNNEALLIDTLRKTPEFVPGLSLVGRYCDKVVGHVLMYPVAIVEGDKRTITLALEPISVLPAYQKKGIGSKLVKVGLSKAKKLGFGSVVVVGHPEYYPQFGFMPAGRWNIKVPFEATDNVVMAIELIPGALENAAGTVSYPSPFSEV
ncbi:MAG: N-acetyltransferase [Elusimicrobia bacterium]|nr:N-acetyltransferase [Elusimicrobiota bacterium]